MRLIYFLFFLLLISCGVRESKMNVEKGTFQAIKPPNIYGNSRYLTKDTNYIISYDANIGKNKTIYLPEIINLSTEAGGDVLPEMPANIYYRLIENTLGFQFYKTMKYNNLYTGLGGGVQNFPYGFFMWGYNGKYIEVGSVVFWGLAINNASYGGIWEYYSYDPWGGSPGGFKIFTPAERETDQDENDYFKIKKINILHSYGGLVTHASFYWEKFAINYAASVSNPWFVDELPASKSENADISFSFPALLMQDIGISYTPYKIKYRLGVNQITGVKFPGQYWGISGQIAYLF
jgi:hypothetical protein